METATWMGTAEGSPKWVVAVWAEKLTFLFAILEWRCHFGSVNMNKLELS